MGGIMPACSGPEADPAKARVRESFSGSIRGVVLALGVEGRLEADQVAVGVGHEELRDLNIACLSSVRYHFDSGP